MWMKRVTVWSLMAVMATEAFIADQALAQPIELMQEGMSANQSGRTAKRAFDQRAREIERSEDWSAEPEYMGSVRVTRVERSEFRVCPIEGIEGLKAKRRKVTVSAGEDGCWLVTGKKRPEVLVEGSGQTVTCRLQGKISEERLMGVFVVSIPEKEVIDKPHCPMKRER